MRRLATVPIAFLLLASRTAGQEGPAADSLRQVAETAPLFASHDVFDVRIEAPLATILKDRHDDSEYYPGTLTYVDATGDSVVLDIRAKTRGHFRLLPRTCNFPNLHIDFRREQVAHTVFAGQNRIDIIAHCQDNRSEYEQFTLQEYLIYRTFNLLTDASVRARLTRATYIDTDGKRDSMTKYMVFLEPMEMVAARHGWQIIEVPAVPPSQHDPFALPLVEVFQFMIGNTDWSPFKKSTNGFCCHNGRLMGTLTPPVTLVPYDFDWSGVISAPYARPAPDVGTVSVRQRKYMGICRPMAEFEGVFALFNERRAAIYDLWRGEEGLEEGKLARTLEYFDDFYEIINDPGNVKGKILRDCQDMSYLDHYVGSALRGRAVPDELPQASDG